MKLASTFAFFFLLASNSVSASKDTIIWAVGHQPPRVTFDGKNTLGGQGGIQQNLLSQGLADSYDAKYVSMNWARLENEFSQGKKICSSFLLETPDRVLSGVFSIPWHIDLPHHVAILKSAYERIGKPTAISLSQLMMEPTVSGVIEKGRSYGNLDNLLRSPPHRNNLTVVSTRPIQSLHMLRKGRMEYSIEYPYFIDYFQQLYGNPQQPIISVPIEEAGEFYYTRVGCSNTQWGKTVIARVNEVIRKTRESQSYLELLKMVYISQRDKAEIEKIYQQAFISSE